MSLLSATCAYLRIMARFVQEYDHCEISQSLREAADVIDKLNGRCRDLQNESEQLRETMAQMAHDHAEQAREIKALKALVREMLRYIDPVEHQDTCGMECPAHRTCAGKSMCTFPDWTIGAAREIGIEANDDR